MKTMNDKTKKRLIVAGSLVVCAALVVLIGSRFISDKPADQPITSESSQPSNVTIDNDTEKKSDVVVITPDTTKPVTTDNGADFTGTEQTIQGDVTKPEYTDDQLTDPSQKPNGEAATATPKSTDSSAQQTTGTSSGGSSSSGGLPGFDSVPDGGANQVIDGESTGDINKQVGNMN